MIKQGENMKLFNKIKAFFSDSNVTVTNNDTNLLQKVETSQVFYKPETDEIIVFTTSNGMTYGYDDGKYRLNINDNLYNRWKSEMILLGDL